MTILSLEKVRADGWLDQLGEGSSGFSQLCEVVGRNFVAFSVIAGIRITALTVDPRAPAASIVEFEIGEMGGPQRLALGELRERLAQAMLSDDAPASPPASKVLAGSPSSETLQSYIGFRYVLLAPLYGIGMEALRIDGDDAYVRVHQDGEEEELSLRAFRDRVRLAVQDEVSQQRSASPFAIDLEAVDPARRAAEGGDWARVADLLGSWPGPLSMLLRTAEGQNLAPDVRATLAEALGLLGTAHVELGRYEWAHEILRLGIQWAQDHVEVSATLFRRLASAHHAQDRHGEAIGLYRRALALGAPRSEVLPELARCFLARGRTIAALMTAEEAVAAGAGASAVQSVREAAKEELGDDLERFRARVRV